MNDLIELHQNEIENLKQGIADMEEKIQYQSEERLRDVYEMLDSCQTRVILTVMSCYPHLLIIANNDTTDIPNGTSAASTPATISEFRFPREFKCPGFSFKVNQCPPDHSSGYITFGSYGCIYPHTISPLQVWFITMCVDDD